MLLGWKLALTELTLPLNRYHAKKVHICSQDLEELFIESVRTEALGSLQT